MYINCTQNVWVRFSRRVSDGITQCRGAVYKHPTANRSDGVRHEHAYARRCRSHARRCYNCPWKADSHSNNGRVTGSVLSTHVHVLPRQRLEPQTTRDNRQDMTEDMTRPQTRHYILLWPHHPIIISKISVGVCMSKYAHTHPQRYLRKHDRVVGG